MVSKRKTKIETEIRISLDQPNEPIFMNEELVTKLQRFGNGKVKRVINIGDRQGYEVDFIPQYDQKLGITTNKKTVSELESYLNKYWKEYYIHYDDDMGKAYINSSEERNHDKDMITHPNTQDKNIIEFYANSLIKDDIERFKKMGKNETVKCLNKERQLLFTELNNIEDRKSSKWKSIKENMFKTLNECEKL